MEYSTSDREYVYSDVKPMHCKAVLNRMEVTYAGSTIRQAYITMATMLKSAVMNDIIAKHPMNGVRYTKQFGQLMMLNI